MTNEIQTQEINDETFENEEEQSETVETEETESTTGAKEISEEKLELEKAKKEIQELKKLKEEEAKSVAAETAIKMPSGRYFPSENEQLATLQMDSPRGLVFDTFTYVYDLSRDRSPFVQVSNYNGTTKELTYKNFIDDIKMSFWHDYGEILRIRPKARQINREDGSFVLDEKGHCTNVSEVQILINMMDKVHGFMYTPNEKHQAVYHSRENGRCFYNTFCAPKKLKDLKEKSKNLSRIDKITPKTAVENGYPTIYAFYKNLLNPNNEDNKGRIKYGKEDDDVMDLFLNKEAYMLQTLNKTNTYFIFSSEQQGVGKGAHYKNLREYLLGDERSHMAGSDALLEDKNGYMMGKMFICFDEVVVGEKDSPDKVYNRIKGLIEKKLDIRAMYSDRVNAQAPFNFEIFSNYDIVMKIAYGDRRANCIKAGAYLGETLFHKLGLDGYEEFEKQFKKEVDNFAIDLLRINYNTNMAVNGIVYNEYRDRLIRNTNSRKDIVKDLVEHNQIGKLKNFFDGTAHQEKLEKMLEHVERRFLMAEDIDFMTNELYEDLKMNENNFDKNLVWSRMFGEYKTVDFKTDDGSRTSKKIKKLSGFERKNLVNYFTTYNEEKDIDLPDDSDFDDDFNSDKLSIEKDEEKDDLVSKATDFINSI